MTKHMILCAALVILTLLASSMGAHAQPKTTISVTVINSAETSNAPDAEKYVETEYASALCPPNTNPSVECQFQTTQEFACMVTCDDTPSPSSLPPAALASLP